MNEILTHWPEIGQIMATMIGCFWIMKAYYDLGSRIDAQGQRIDAQGARIDATLKEIYELRLAFEKGKK